MGKSKFVPASRYGKVKDFRAFLTERNHDPKYKVANEMVAAAVEAGVTDFSDMLGRKQGQVYERLYKQCLEQSNIQGAFKPVQKIPTNPLGPGRNSTLDLGRNSLLGPGRNNPLGPARNRHLAAARKRGASKPAQKIPIKVNRVQPSSPDKKMNAPTKQKQTLTFRKYLQNKNSKYADVNERIAAAVDANIDFSMVLEYRQAQIYKKLYKGWIEQLSNV